jgi:hypothetical protein
VANPNPTPTPENLRPWKPGQSGNPGGRPKKRPVSEELASLLGENDGAASKALAKVLLREALKGDIAFVRELLNRIEGKVPDKVEVKENEARRRPHAIDDDPDDDDDGPGEDAGQPPSVEGSA